MNRRTFIKGIIGITGTFISPSAASSYTGDKSIYQTPEEPPVLDNLNIDNYDFYFEVYKEKVPRLTLKRNLQNIESNVLEVQVALGSKGRSTPSGDFYLRRIIENPFWYPPSWSDQKKPSRPGKDNPYGLWMSELSTINAPGDYDFSVSGDTKIRIHSTNSPNSIGKYASHGCIRLHPDVAEKLFPYLLENISHLPPKKNSRGTIYPLDKAIPITIK